MPLDIITEVSSLAYRLQLPESMKGAHNVFHLNVHKVFVGSIVKGRVRADHDKTGLDSLVSPCLYESSKHVLRRMTIKYVSLWTN